MMGPKNEEQLDEGESLFLERAEEKIKIIKHELGVKTDAELGKLLGNISQQAISDARKKNKVPSTWLRKLMKQGVSVDSIFKDSTDQAKKNKPTVSKGDDSFSISYKKLIVSENDKAKMGMKKKAHLENVIAQKIILLAANKISILPKEYESEMLKVYTVQHVLPKAVEQVADLLQKFHETERPYVSDSP